MTIQNVTCPNCNHEFELGRALTDKLASALREEMETKISAREKELNIQLTDLKHKREAIEEEVAGRVRAERDKLATEAKLSAREEVGVELQAAKDALAEKSKKLKLANEMELAFRKKERELIEQKEAQELELLRRIDKEREIIARKAVETAEQQQVLRLREKENLIQSLREQVGDLKRRMEVGSQEGQGEALEEELISILRSRYAFDEFAEIKKGQRGADILQTVRNRNGAPCGTIVWETKNTKAFSNGWIDKLKEDRQRAGADLAVLVTMAMPTGVEHFDLLEDIWVSGFASARSLCGVLRELLIDVNREKLVSASHGEVRDLIYQYVTGQEFIGRVKRISSAYTNMQTDLAQEKRAMERIWKKREKQIHTVLDNLSGMHGELEGLLVGGEAVIPAIEGLSLDDIGSDEEGS